MNTIIERTIRVVRYECEPVEMYEDGIRRWHWEVRGFERDGDGLVSTKPSITNYRARDGEWLNRMRAWCSRHNWNIASIGPHSKNGRFAITPNHNANPQFVEVVIEDAICDDDISASDVDERF
jgi:hypothetical protein